MFKKQLSVLPIAILTSCLSLIGCQNTKPLINHQTNSGIDSSEHIGNDNSSNGEKNIQLNDLTKFKWHLVTALDNHKQPITILDRIKNDVRLSFNQPTEGSVTTLGFSVGCNSMGADFSLMGDMLKVGQIIATQMYCEDLDEAERLLSRAMSGSSQLSYRIDTVSNSSMPILTQKTSNGEAFVWKGIQRPETKYQQRPDIVYWEIDHHQPQCPDSSTESCLKVRQVYYNKQGIKTGVGEWQLFVGSIEGYTHDSGLNNVVRLKRFTIDPVDVKGKQFVYTLDRIVESSVVQ